MTNRLHTFLSSHVAPLDAFYGRFDEDHLDGTRRADAPASVATAPRTDTARARLRHLTH